MMGVFGIEVLLVFFFEVDFIVLECFFIGNEFSNLVFELFFLLFWVGLEGMIIFVFVFVLKGIVEKERKGKRGDSLKKFIILVFFI